jgi:hypothetical protein
VDWQFISDEMAAGRPVQTSWLTDGTSSAAAPGAGSGRRLLADGDTLDLDPLATALEGDSSKGLGRQLLQNVAPNAPLQGPVTTTFTEVRRAAAAKAAVGPAAAVAGAATASVAATAAAAASPLCLRLLNFASGGRGAALAAQLGNGACNGGPFNTEACGYDGGGEC